MNSFPEWERMLAPRHGRCGAERLNKTKGQQWQINWEASSRFVWLSVTVFKAIWVFPAIREYMRSYVGQCVALFLTNLKLYSYLSKHRGSAAGICLNWRTNLLDKSMNASIGIKSQRHRCYASTKLFSRSTNRKKHIN